ncbi:hypothetical protein BN59_00334 [Legionella massiliensis]|uniref:Transmembrane protein n=1 Tax=Legionella massiliensis TaxID=1034943 RepID=A0A078KNW8_9GAMM|nr:hypothetical protein [Legionella massiliensis]CDZ76070.1 hypothetical protein BN59_00334 [Legionella massiliensis]CEE11808.1 hypothetical protein BN1094_00334 [Legionella massiliensis]
MTTETLSEGDSSNHKPSSLDLLAGRMDAQSRLLAKKLHELGYIYVLFGALDGLSLSYSMMKYYFDMLLANSDLSSSDEMHDWMTSPEGAAIAATTSISLIVFSMLANHFDDEDQNVFKRYIAVIWPYCRDTMKGLKNAYKGLKSTLQVAEILGGGDFSYLIVPVGLLLGGLSVINRIWFRWMVNERKAMMKANAKILDDIQNSPDITLERLEELKGDIKRQSDSIRSMAMLSAAYGGVVDGLYLYIGVLGICSLSPPALIAMTVFCSIYLAACIATRMYEEYDFQRKLLISQTKIELAYEGKRIELLFAELQRITTELSSSPDNHDLLNEQEVAINLFQVAAWEFKEQRKKLLDLSTLSYTSAFLAGAKNGLAAYGALASVIFAVGTILALSSIAFPPALLISCISFGMVFMIGFIVHSLVHAYYHRIKVEQQQNEESKVILQEKVIQQEKITPKEVSLAEIGPLFKDAKQQVKDLRPEEVRTAILDGMVVDPSPQFFFQEWFEILRSSSSGVGKGAKAINLAMNSFEEKTDTDGHYHETPIMMGFIAVSAIVHAAAFGLRAHSRGFGRPPIDQVPSKINDDTAIELEEMTPGSKTEDDLTPQDNTEQQTVSAPRQESFFGSMYSFFCGGKQQREADVSETNPVEDSSLASEEPVSRWKAVRRNFQTNGAIQDESQENAAFSQPNSPRSSHTLASYS